MNLRSKLAGLSLATRISCVVACLLIAAGAVTGYAVYGRVKHSLREALNARLDARLAWLQACIEVDEGRLDFESKAGNVTETDAWRVATQDGKVLWSSHWAEPNSDTVTRTRDVVYGEPGAALAGGNALQPAPAADAKPGSVSGFRLPEKSGAVALRLSVNATNTHMREELARLGLALWTIGPLAIVIITALLAIFIRWQLAPLSAMSRQAVNIGPENTAARIGDVGSSAECVQLKDSINRMVARLAEGLERERQFASMAAHELRTPVAQLRTQIEVSLRKERQAGEYRATMQDALADVERLQKLIASLLFLTRSGQAVQADAIANLNEVVTQAVKVSGTAPAGIENVPPMKVHGDLDLLVTALRNVLGNAARYAPGGPPVLATSESAEYVILSVTDSGPGISEKDRERIFDPLTRLDAARSIGPSADGFGLGLTVARAAVRACGGELICREREDGQSGAEFVFRLKRPPQRDA